MADRDCSFFGPVLPQEEGAPEAFSFAELRRIQCRRREADEALEGESGWPERLRFEMLLPPPPLESSRRMRCARVVSGSPA